MVMNKLLLQIALSVKPYVEAYRILILNDIQLVLAKKIHKWKDKIIYVKCLISFFTYSSISIDFMIFKAHKTLVLTSPKDTLSRFMQI